MGESLVSGRSGEESARPRLRVELSGHGRYLLLNVWMILGLFLDALAHAQGRVETFFSIWHLIFYSGFLASGLWLVWPVARALRAGSRLSDAIPIGYDLGLVGMLLVIAGGLTDMVWHIAFGIETGTAVLVSPPHVFLVTGLVLMALCPFRALWASTAADDAAPTLRTLLPAVLSLTLATSLVALDAIPVWGFARRALVAEGSFERLLALLGTSDTTGRLLEYTYERQLAKMVLTTLVLLTPVLMMVRRWRLPFGSVTILVATPATLVSSLTTGVPALTMLPESVLAGLVGDWLLRAWRPSPQRLAQFRAFATVLPMVLWSLDFAVIQLRAGVAWPAALWVGSLLWTGGAGLLLSVVVVPGRLSTS